LYICTYLHIQIHFYMYTCTQYVKEYMLFVLFSAGTFGGAHIGSGTNDICVITMFVFFFTCKWIHVYIHTYMQTCMHMSISISLSVSLFVVAFGGARSSPYKNIFAWSSINHERGILAHIHTLGYVNLWSPPLDHKWEILVHIYIPTYQVLSYMCTKILTHVTHTYVISLWYIWGILVHAYIHEYSNLRYSGTFLRTYIHVSYFW